MGELDALAESIILDPIEATGDIYHPIPFKEFNQLKPAVREQAVSNKFKLIRSALPFDDFKDIGVLDIGANAGYFSYRFADLGATVDAIEPSERYYEIGQSITSHYTLNVNWYHQNIDSEFLSGRNYSITLMLSVFQWISNGNEKLDDARELLNLISRKSDYLFFELGCNWGTSGIDAKGPALTWIYKLLKEDTTYSRVGYLGSLRLWGNIQSKWRFNRYLFCASNESINLNAWQRFLTGVLKSL